MTQFKGYVWLKCFWAMTYLHFILISSCSIKTKVREANGKRRIKPPPTSPNCLQYKPVSYQHATIPPQNSPVSFSRSRKLSKEKISYLLVTILFIATNSIVEGNDLEVSAPPGNLISRVKEILLLKARSWL